MFSKCITYLQTQDLCLYSINPSMLCNNMYSNMIISIQHWLSLSLLIIQVAWLLYNIPSFTVYCRTFLKSLFAFWRRLKLHGFVCAFRSACEEDERINQSATCLFNVNDLLSTCPSADCNWQTDFDRKLLLADCLSCVLSVSDHHFSFCPLLQMKVEDKERRKRGKYFRKLWIEGEIWAPVEKQERNHQGFC